MAPLYQRMREGYEKELARDKAKEAMKPGNPAPEFTLKDLDGKNFDLSSLRGKYVVLDFWGKLVWMVHKRNSRNEKGI